MCFRVPHYIIMGLLPTVEVFLTYLLQPFSKETSCLWKNRWSASTIKNSVSSACLLSNMYGIATSLTQSTVASVAVTTERVGDYTAERVSMLSPPKGSVI